MRPSTEIPGAKKHLSLQDGVFHRPVVNQYMQKEKLVREAEEVSVNSCADLSPGDEIAGTHRGALVHRWRVTDIASDHGMFWIMDDLNGGRRLVDLAEVQVMRTKGAAAESLAVG